MKSKPSSKRRTRDLTAVTNGNNGRRSDGRFAPGNQVARGRRTPTGEARAAFRKGVTARELTRIAKKLATAALGGDTTAASIILDRTIGRARQETDDAQLALELPPLDSIASCSKAMASIVASAAAGNVTLDDAQRAARLVEQTRDTLAATELETRLAELEAAIALQNAS